tara:strand:- start:266 stop:982 length:717 start_codon:yes stop_codon:yes gene_type:complete
MTINERLDADLMRANLLSTQIMDGMVSRYRYNDPEFGKLPIYSCDIDKFFELTKDCIDDYQDRTDISEQNQVMFSEEGPAQDAFTEYITYRVTDRRPGKRSGGRHGGAELGKDGIREWRPQLRRIQEDPDDVTKKELIMGQFFDNVVEFSCWAQTNKAVNARALWFEDLMSSYHWYLRLNGVKECYFVRRQEDEDFDGLLGGNTLKRRKLCFFVRTDRTFSIKRSVLRDLIVRVGVLT